MDTEAIIIFCAARRMGFTEEEARALMWATINGHRKMTRYIITTNGDVPDWCIQALDRTILPKNFVKLVSGVFECFTTGEIENLLENYQ